MLGTVLYLVAICALAFVLGSRLASLRDRYPELDPDAVGPHNREAEECRRCGEELTGREPNYRAGVRWCEPCQRGVRHG